MNKIIVKKAYLPSIANEEKFINAIQLGRIVGAIRCNNILQLKTINSDEPNVSINIYLLLNHAALLYEGIKYFNNAKSDYEELLYYKENGDKINTIINEFNQLESFSNSVLKKIRNKIAFHFDKAVIKSIIEKFVEDSLKEKRDVVLISGRSTLIKDTVHSMADNMNINYILNSINGRTLSEEERFKIVSEKLLELSGLFCNIIDELIPDLVEEYCEVKEEE